MRRAATHSQAQSVGRILLLLSAAFLRCAAQQEGDTTRQGTGWVKIETGPAGCSASIDSLVVTSPAALSAAAGLHLVRVFPPGPALWSEPPKVDTIHVAAAETTLVRYSFPVLRAVYSSPSGAEVVTRGAVLGRTPLLVSDSIRSPLLMRLQGFLPDSVKPVEGHAVFASLQPVPGVKVEEVLLKPTELLPRSNGLLIAGAATIATGVAAVIFKQKADRAFDSYLESRNQAFLDRTHRFDTYSSIGLALMEAGTALLVFLLLAE